MNFAVVINLNDILYVVGFNFEERKYFSCLKLTISLNQIIP